MAREPVENLPYLSRLDAQMDEAHGNNRRRHRVSRGSLRNGCTVAIIWRDTEGRTKEHWERNRKFVAVQELADDADEVFADGH
ncbi:MAG: hypothetical protein N3B14_00315 [Thermoleophilia bacterium]|nr:hypothetical protein [Thermoleophilia bacterium]